ncbi:endolytic transglycosylase MltG [Candidatus Berkelbacteria bacterium]|nr:endolytic transglycosylase MltG [Candidatus Berkelbacteria bacterium]
MDKKLMIGLAVAVVSLASFLGWYTFELNRFTKPVGGSSVTQTVEITPKTSSWFVAQRLNEKGLIRSAAFFWLYQKLTGSSLQAGIYYANASQTGKQILNTIATGRVSEYRVTIPEGWRTEQIGQRLADRSIVAYADFVAAAAGKEGMLFPDTYQISVKATSSDIVAIMTKNFDKRLKEAGIDRISQSDLTIASIVEREAKRDEDRPKMAGVYKNRLAVNMALEADPTVQYAVDSVKLKQAVNPLTVKFWGAVGGDQVKNVESPYNTYRRSGLPSGPISNPGITSIQAAINPEKHEFYFFFNLPDGSTIYSKTRDEHNANRRKYGI